MIYIAICDDNEKELELLNEKVIIYLQNNDVLADITIYTQSRMLKYDVQEGKHFDLILTDIEMPNIDGMELVAYIKKYLPEVFIIFFTAHLKYAIDAFELNIFRYVPKNSSAVRLEHALRDAINMITLQSNDYYVIQMPSRVEKIPYKNIMYIQREGKNSVMVLKDNSVSRIRKSLSQLIKEFNQEDFVYIERGTIVNLAHIMSLNEGIVKLDNGMILHPSRAKIDEVKEKLARFWGKQI